MKDLKFSKSWVGAAVLAITVSLGGAVTSAPAMAAPQTTQKATPQKKAKAADVGAQRRHRHVHRHHHYRHHGYYPRVYGPRYGYGYRPYYRSYDSPAYYGHPYAYRPAYYGGYGYRPYGYGYGPGYGFGGSSIGFSFGGW